MDSKVRYYIGTSPRGFRPSGYTTVDISVENQPDIVADAASLPMIATASADEVYASHVLEHFSWPRALLVLNEWARILKVGGTLKIAVPDMELYALRLINGDDQFTAMIDIYAGHWDGEGGPQGHNFGYTRRMLVQVLMVMGFADFGFWRSDLPEAANAWCHGENQEQLGLSINVSCIKKRAPLFDVEKLYQRVRYHDLRGSFMVLVRKLLIEEARLSGVPDIDAILFQRLNFQYLEAAHKAQYWEAKYRELEKSSNR